jgi:hypothetical protein
LLKLLCECGLETRKRMGAATVLAEKCDIYAQGLLRRSRLAESKFYSAIGLAAQSWFNSGVEPAVGYWSAALRDLPLKVEAG